MSPSEQFLAILTEHTVHVAVLPDSSRLADPEKSPLKLKTFQLGPTIHVIPQSPVVRALWHPLAASDNASDCLVTITASSAVRIWELDRSNHLSFDRPSLAIDLRKLIDGTSCEQEFEPAGFGKSTGFSVDAFDMEATSACFGGQGREDEDGWAAMTLWVSMRNGDVYALCPLLPSKWRPSANMIPSLTTDVVSKMTGIDPKQAESDHIASLQQQYEWVQEIDNEEPISEGSLMQPWAEEVRHRPSMPSAIPRLQGPFEFLTDEDDDELEVSDIHVMPSRLNVDESAFGDDEDMAEVEAELQYGLPATLICLATTMGDIHVLMDVDGVSGQWLPKKESNRFLVPNSDSKELILVESLHLDKRRKKDSGWPTFSAESTSRYDFYTTMNQHVFFFSFEDWALRLSSEISAAQIGDSGLKVRLRVASESPITVEEEILAVETQDTTTNLLSAPVVLNDPSLGHLLLSVTDDTAYAASFDRQNGVLDEPRQPLIPTGNRLPPSRSLDLVLASAATEDDVMPARSPYSPPTIFYQDPSMALRSFLSAGIPQRHKATLKQEIRLSPANLEIMNSTHRILSPTMLQLETAAVDVFRRCERLREELSNQVHQLTELAARILDSGCPDGEDALKSRIDEAAQRQQRLTERHEGLRRKLARVGAGGRALSTQEVSWMEEVAALCLTAGLETSDNTQGMARQDGGLLEGRFQKVNDLANTLLAQVDAAEKQQPPAESAQGTPSIARPRPGLSHRSGPEAGGAIALSRLQRAKITEAMSLIERESAVIDAVTARLERLRVEE